MSKVLLFDFLSRGFGHTSFNRCMAQMALGLPGVDQLDFFAESSHLEIFQKLLPESLQQKVNMQRLDPIPTSQYSSFYEAWGASEGARKLIEKRVNESGATRVFVLGFTGLLLRQLRNLKLKEGVRVELLAHGNIAEILAKTGLNPLRRIQSMGHQLRVPLPAWMRFVILERDIADTLHNSWGVSLSSIKVMELPIVPDELPTWNPSTRSHRGMLDIGFLGDPRPQKGFGQFLATASEFHAKDFSFHAIGREVPSMPKDGLQFLSTVPAKIPLERSAYLNAIRQVDLVCVPFLPEYRLIPSGSLVDAITQLKPLVYPGSAAFEKITERFGPIGYAYSTETTMANAFNAISEKKFLEDLPQFKLNLRKIQDERHPDQLSRHF
jgi:hypothetical protein